MRRGSGALIVVLALLFAPSAWAGTLVGDPTQKLTYLERMNVARTKTAPVLVDPKRCGCPEWGSGGDATCFDPDLGSCGQEAPLEENPNAGTGWIPVERNECFLRQGYGVASASGRDPAVAR